MINKAASLEEYKYINYKYSFSIKVIYLLIKS